MLKKRLTFIFLLIIGLSLISFSFFSLTKKENAPSKKTLGVKTEKNVSSKPSLSPSPSLLATYIPTVAPVIPTSTPVPTIAPTSPPTQAPTQAPQNQSFQVSVSINGGGSFTVNVDPGNNQCDVLRKALEQGKISSLNMRFDNSLGSDAVYQINGTGKDNSVWWTYKVNGTSPSQGCSFIKANSGDKVEWEYLGQ